MAAARDSGGGTLHGELDEGEDRDTIVDLLHNAAERVRCGELDLLCHQDLEPMASPAERDQARQKLREALVDGRLKHFAVRVPTAAGPRIVKISEASSLGGQLLGLVGISRSRREHRLHARGHQLNVAAAPSHGFLELRHGVRLLNSCQVQAIVADGLLPLALFLQQQHITHGDEAFGALGRALAETHAVPFFHCDLKSFHTFVSDIIPGDGGPATYRLRYIDLDRVAFWMSRRKRIINLYQALRHVLPDTLAAQEKFVFAYCAASGWYAHNPAQGLKVVLRFLDYKRRTHPYP